MGIIDNRMAQNLIYKRAEDIILKIEAYSYISNNKKIKVTIGDEGGELRTIYAQYLTEPQLLQYAAQMYNYLKVDGYRGTFETFGEPAVSANDIINITGDDDHPSGTYQVKSVETRFGIGGYKQIIEPDIMLNTYTNK